MAEIGVGLCFERVGRTQSVAPRVCVKSFADDSMVDLYRSYRGKRKGTVYTLATDNSAFAALRDNQRYFHEPNIPSSALSGTYQNARIDPEKLANYQAGTHSPDKQAAGTQPNYYDADWQAVWVDGDSANYRACYKSTLVMPLCIKGELNNEAHEKLYRLFSTTESLLFGVLCIDHVMPDYFDLDTDIALCTIYADMVSMPFVAVHNLTRSSSTFQQVRAYIQANAPDEYASLYDAKLSELTLELTGDDSQTDILDSMDGEQDQDRYAQYYVSYCADDAQDNNHLVERFCEQAEHFGVGIQRESDHDGSINDFMLNQLAYGECIYIFLSERYLRSTYCMTELHAIWDRCKKHNIPFNQCVRVHLASGIVPGSAQQRLDTRTYWANQVKAYNDAFEKASDVTPAIATEIQKIKTFRNEVNDILQEIFDRPHYRDEASLFDGLRKMSVRAP